MELKTRFDIGDTVSAIENHAVTNFTVNAVVVTKEGVMYRSPNYNTYKESECFANRQEVFDYILGNTKENDKQKRQTTNTESNEPF